ncbi:MAG: hypothetical protein WBE80_00760 [Methylocella sp.]
MARLKGFLTEIAWKVQLDRRAFAGLAVDIQMSAGLFDGAVDLRKPGSGAFAGGFRRKKRIERAPQLAGTSLMPADAKVCGDAVARIGPAPALHPVCLAAGAAWQPLRQFGARCPSD